MTSGRRPLQRLCKPSGDSVTDPDVEPEKSLVKIPRKMLRAGWPSAASVLTVVALAVVVTVPASADVTVQEVVEVRGISFGGQVIEHYDPSQALLLDHFYFRDVSGDQHLYRVEALPLFQLMFIDFSDEDPQEQFEYRVAHSRVAPTGMIRGSYRQEFCVGKCIQEITKPAGDYVFVLEGFSFAFVGGDDHHIDEIGVLENEGVLTAYYNDQNDDDEFEVSVEYWWVPRSMLSDITAVSASRVQDTGTARRTIAAGTKVIRGFHVDNLASGGGGDNHIKRFGLLTNSTTVDIYYGDQNPADSADWSYLFRYATLR